MPDRSPRPATPTERPDRPEPLTEQAYNRLEELIVTLQLAPGELLSEQALVERTGLGRTPIREALQRLAREGLIEVLPRRGIAVTGVASADQLLVLEVRRELERLLSRTAAARATADERETLRALADGMEAASAATDDIAFMRLDRHMNRLVVAAAHNEHAARAMRQLAGLSRRFWYHHYREAADLPLCARLHAAQARAIAEGDAEAAAAACDRLMDYVETFTRASGIRPPATERRRSIQAKGAKSR